MIPTEPFEYLKEHLGCKWSIAEFGKHKRKWSKGPVLTLEDIYNNKEINCCQELPNEITLESDYKGEEQYKNQENLDYAENKLQESLASYYISSHKGKSDYIRFRFKTKRDITPELRLAIIRYFTKPGLLMDEAFFSINYVRPVPGRLHWKHSNQIEKVTKEILGPILDIDKFGIKAPIKSKPMKIHSGSMPFLRPMGWALSINIKRMAERRGLLNCPQCDITFNFNEYLGRFSCSKCKLKGGIKDLLKLSNLYGGVSKK